MGLLDKLKNGHRELVQDQALLIAAQAQARRRGDDAAAADYGARLDGIAPKMRAAERLINDETGEEYYAT